MPDTKCGTYAGWNQHKRHKTPPCIACREAARQYQLQRRRNSSEARAANQIYIDAGKLARRELAKRHASEYRQLYNNYKKRLASIHADQ